MLQSFKQILDRSMRTVSVVDVLFACVIAFGVVYNGARIALSERGHELASLRVLGFTRGEVTGLLLGEQACSRCWPSRSASRSASGPPGCSSRRLNTELYRIPLVLDSATFSFAVLVIVIAALLSGMLVARRINRLDLVAVLKTREYRMPLSAPRRKLLYAVLGAAAIGAIVWGFVPEPVAVEVDRRSARPAPGDSRRRRGDARA